MSGCHDNCFIVLNCANLAVFALLLGSMELSFLNICNDRVNNAASIFFFINVVNLFFQIYCVICVEN